jgi:hypothetical protein
MAFDAAGASRDEIVALLFQASMSGDLKRFAHDNGIDVATLRQLKVRHLEDYVSFLEAVLFRIKDQIDY